MSTITVHYIEEEHVWENFLATHPETSFLQSWYWGTFHQNLGDKICRVGFYNGHELAGVMLSIVEDAKRGRYLTVPGGPIIDWQNSEVIEAFVTEIRRQAVQEKCVFVRVRPQIEETESTLALFDKLGFRIAPMHLSADLTHQLDITLPEEQLLANMRKSTRYEIKKGLSEGITITTSTNPDDVQAFYDRQLVTAKRQKFTPFSYKFWHEQFKVFAQNGKVLLYSAYLGDTLLAQSFIIFYGAEAVYHYSISTDAGREHPGSYMIQWAAIQEAKRRGISRYNFWGVADDPRHRYYSLSIFKRGFGGYDFRYVRAHDLVIQPALYLVNFVIEHARKRMRNL